MSNFNEYFKSQGAEKLVTRFFGSADIYNNECKIKNLTFDIEDQPLPASYYTENALTATFKVRIEYQINDDPEVFLSEFEVPKEVDGTFIIDGSYRVSTNRLSSDYDCRINMIGTGDHSINFDYFRKYDIDRQVLKIKKNDYELSLIDRDVNIKFADIDTCSDELKELLKLTELQSKKFQIKLDLDYKPEYITQKLINECIAFGDDRDKDLIIDKKIESVAASFMNWVFRGNNCRNYHSARGKITTHFLRYNRLPTQANVLTNLFKKFFKGSQDVKDSGLQVPPGVNALNLDSIGSKITIPKTVAYNQTMSDLIDFSDTPINGNTNIQNSLTVSTHINDDGTVLFDVFDRNFKRITIQYVDYLNSKIVSSDYVDYEHKQLKPNKDGEVEVKYRMKRKMVRVEDIDMIDLHPDYRLSSTSRRMPFINYTDSVRISMGCSMIRQSIPLTNAQRSLVDTGRSEEMEDNVLNEKFNYPEGKVTKITESEVIVTLPDKTEVNIPRRTAIHSINDIAVFTEPKVKVGQKIKKGDTVTGAVGLSPETYKVGVNALVLFHAYHGLVNEDALVISESFANRIASNSFIDVAINVKHSAALKWIAPIGTKVKSGDPLVKLHRAVKLNEINESLNTKLGGLFEGDLDEYTKEFSMNTPNNIDDAVVADVMIQENKSPKMSKKEKAVDYRFSHTSQPVIDDYYSTMEEARKKHIYKSYPEHVASDRLRPVVMNPNDFKVVYTVRIRLIKRTIGMPGFKITNRYGGKGVVSVVKPDEDMPIMVDKSSGEKRRIEVVMNPYSTISRKIVGVLSEQLLGNIAHRIYDLVEKYKSSKTGQKQIMPLLEKYYPGRYDGMKVEDFIKLHESKPIEEVYYFQVGCFSDFSPEKIEQWAKELGVDSRSEILLPEEEVTDMEELKENLSQEEFDAFQKKIKGKFTKVEKELQCGWMTLEVLQHLPSYSCKVSSSMFGIDVNSKRDQPIMGMGKYRQTGQKIGEMDLWALLSRNSKKFVQDSREHMARENNQIFLNNLLGLGLAISDSKGYNQGGSNLKTQLDAMKKKFRLKGTK